MIALMIALGCGHDHDHDHGEIADTAGQLDPDAEANADPAAGEAVYASTCQGCHEGGSGPEMDETAPKHSDQELVFVIRNGAGDMPPLDLGDQDIADVIAHLRAAF